MNQSLRRINRIFSITLVVVISLLLILGFGFAITSYTGKCYGFTDGVENCTWLQYAMNQLFGAFLLGFMPVVAVCSVWGGAAGFTLAKQRNPNPSQDNLLGQLIGIAVGLGLGAGGGLLIMMALFWLSSLIATTPSR